VQDSLLPPIGTIQPRAFVARPETITRIALLLGAYIGLVLYPAYGFLRLYWTGSASAFDFSGLMIAAITATLFALFARRTMLRYFNVGATPD
jgi:hypothetical protein